MEEVGMTNASIRNIRINVAANTAKIIASAHSLTGDFLNGFCETNLLYCLVSFAILAASIASKIDFS